MKKYSTTYGKLPSGVTCTAQYVSADVLVGVPGESCWNISDWMVPPLYADASAWWRAVAEVAELCQEYIEVVVFNR